MSKATLVHFIYQIIPWRTIALISIPIILQATVMRKRGGFTYRRIVSAILILVTAFYCSIIAVVLRILGKGHESHQYASVFHTRLVRMFLGLNAIVEGEEYMDTKKPAIYVLNHQTMLDLHFFSFKVPTNTTTIVAKKALKYYPFVGSFLMAINAIFVDRGKSGEAVKQARQVADSMNRLNTSIYVFPEGTRSGVENVDLLPFKKGAFHMATQAKVPIIPIVIANYKNIYDPKKRFYGHGTIKIRVLPPIPTADVEENSESIGELVKNVREQMLATLKDITVLPDNEKKTS